MACKYTFNNIEYASKEEFIDKVLKKDFINQPKTLRVQEEQSDFFQKWRNNFEFKGNKYTVSKDNQSIYHYYQNGKEINGKEYTSIWDNFLDSPEDSKDAFLKLLQKDGNWVTFFIKSTIQMVAKKGYEKVLFPSGNTASKVEGHTTLEEFKKQKEDAINNAEKEKEKVLAMTLEEAGSDFFNPVMFNSKTKVEQQELINNHISTLDRQINTFKQELERVETEGFSALKPIYNFYENTVTNILKKVVAKENLKTITDEYGNTWNEVEIKPEMINNKILLQLKSYNTEKLNPELADKLETFVKAVGGNIEHVKQILTRTGQTATGSVNTITKVIELVEGTERVALPEEAGHLFEALLNPDSNLYKSMYNNIQKFAIYKNVIEKYSKQYNGNEELLKREAIGQLISKFLINKNYSAEEIQDRNKAQSWFKRVLQYLKELFIQEKPAVDAFKEAANRILNNDITDLGDEFTKTGKLYQLEDVYDESVDANAVAVQLMEYEKKFGPAPVAMKTTLEQLLINKKEYFLTADEKNYEDKSGTIYTRTSDFLQEFVYEEGGKDIPGYFSFGQDPEDFDDNRQWGNQIDDVGRAVILKYTEDEAVLFVKNKRKERLEDGKTSSEAEVNEEALRKTFNELKDFFEENYKEHIIVPQVPFAVKKANGENVAGVEDFVLVDKDGIIRLRDLKSSTKSVYDIPGQPNYNKTFDTKDGKRASKAQRHRAQQSVYKAMAQMQGFVFDERDELGILNFKLDADGVMVEDVRLERELPISSIEQVMESVGTTQLSEEQNKGAGDLIDGMLRILESRVASLKNSLANVKGGKYKIAQLIKLQNTIKDTEKLKAIKDFVDEIYLQVMGNKPANSFLAQFNKELTEIASKDGLEAISELAYYRRNAKLFIDSTREITSFYNQNFEAGTEALDGTTLAKMREIDRMAKAVEDKYNKKIIDLQTDVLAKQISKSANTQVKEEIAAKEKNIKEAKRQGKSEKYIKGLNDDLANFINKAGSRIGIDRILLKSYLENGAFEDIGSADALLSSAGALNAPILSTFFKTIKHKLENVRIKSLDVARKSVKIFNEFKSNSGRNQNNVAEFNEGLYEKVKVFTGKDEEGNDTYKEVAGFVQELDKNAYDLSKSEMFKKVAAIKEGSTKRRLVLDWLEENNEEIGEEDITITNPENGEIVVIEKGKKSILSTLKENMEAGLIGKKEYEYYVTLSKGANRISSTYWDVFTKPKISKFKNANYEALKKNPVTKRYYDYLIATYFKAQESIPETQKLGYILPGIDKNSIDRIREIGIVDWIKTKAKESTSLMDYDTEYGKTSSDVKTIPIMFTTKLDYEQTSLDLLSSVLIFNEAVETFKAQTDLQEFAESLLEKVTEVGPTERTALGEAVTWANKATLSRLGIRSELNEYKTKTGGNNIAAMMAYLIDTHIYNKTKVSAPLKIKGKVVQIDKIYDSIASFVSFVQIGGANWIVPLVNYLNGRVQTGIEQKAKQFFDSKTWNSATYFVDTQGMIELASDMGKPVPESLSGQLLELYNPKNGKLRNELGRDISQSGAKRMLGTSGWFALQKTSEAVIVLQTLVARLKSVKVQSATGEISLFDAYELKNGELSLKDGVQLSGEVDISGRMMMDVKDNVDSLLVKMNGAYDSYSRAEIERYWYGRAVMMFHKFFVPGIKRRYKSLGRDEELGVMTEGFYKTYFNVLLRDTKELMKVYVGMESSLTPMELQNVRRAIKEQMFIAVTGAMIMMLNGWRDDEDKKTKRVLAYPLFVLLKLNTEIGVFGGFGDPQNFLLPNAKEMGRILKSPIPAYQQIEKGLDLINQLTNPTETYKVKSGIWNKGDLKLQAKFFKFWGVTGTNINPEQSLKWWESQLQ
jgi:hypothetical protein